MEQIEDFMPLIPALLEKGLAEQAWDDAIVLMREAVPLLHVADQKQLFTSVLTLLGKEDNASKIIDALYDLGKILIKLGVDPNHRQAVLTFVGSMVVKASTAAPAAPRLPASAR